MNFLKLLFIALSLIGLLLTCQQDHQRITLILDQTISNSYHDALADKSKIKLSANETVVYDNGTWKVSTQSADVQYKQTKFRISLVDSNQDGRFNEPDNDIVILSIYGQDAVPIDLVEDHVSVLRQKTIIQVDRHFFLLEHDPTNEQTLHLLPWDRVPTEAVAASLRTRLNQLAVRSPDGESTYLKFDDQSSALDGYLLFIWNYDETDQALLQQLQTLPTVQQDHLEVLALNMENKPKKLQHFLQQHPSSLLHYLVSSTSCRFINCHARTPFGIQLDKSGNIVNIHLLQEELQGLVSQNLE